MYKVALSSCGKEINEALFEQYKQAGITAMEICSDDFFFKLVGKPSMLRAQMCY